MNKFVGITVGDYEIVDTNIVDNDYEYEEITINELLDRNMYTPEEKLKFLHKYGAVNIHQLVAKETFGSILQLFDDCKEDPRLKGLNAIVLLSLKPKGRGVGYTKLDEADFKIIVNKAFELGISIGFDSCSCLKFLKSVAGDSKLKQYEMMAEPCESGLFSIYINAEGKVFPCSFTEGESLENNDWTAGIDITKIDNFMQDVWYSSLLKTWRKRLIDTAKNNTCNCRECPKYNV